MHKLQWNFNPNTNIFEKENAFENICNMSVILFMMTSSNGNIFHVSGPLCVGIHRSPVNSPHKASDAELWWVFLSAPLINGWVNNSEAGDLRYRRAHYDVTVMFQPQCVDEGDKKDKKHKSW